MKDIMRLLKTGDAEVIATVLVAMLFGWKAVEDKQTKQEDNLSLEVYDLLTRTRLVSQTRAAALLDHFGPPTLLCILAESDRERLCECKGIGPRLSKRLVKALCHLARDRAQVLERELQEHGARPCFERVTLDTEVEKFTAVYEGGYVADEYGHPKWVQERVVVPTWALQPSTPHWTSPVEEMYDGWSGEVPLDLVSERYQAKKTLPDGRVVYLQRVVKVTPLTEHEREVARRAAQARAEARTRPSLKLDSGARRADWDRNGCGFLPEEIEDLIPHGFYSRANPGDRQQHQRFHRWVTFLSKSHSECKLRRAWKSLWKQYFACKEEKTLGSWMSQRQLESVVHLFNEKGIYAKSVDEQKDQVAAVSGGEWQSLSETEPAPKPAPAAPARRPQTAYPVVDPEQKVVAEDLPAMRPCMSMWKWLLSREKRAGNAACRAIAAFERALQNASLNLETVTKEQIASDNTLRRLEAKATKATKKYLRAQELVALESQGRLVAPPCKCDHH